MNHKGSVPPKESLGQPRQRGTLLVELTIASLLVVTALGAIITIFLGTADLRQLDREIYLAFEAARKALEEVRTVDIANIMTLDGTGFEVKSDNGSNDALAPVPGDADGLPGSISVAVENTSGSTTLYRVTTTVDWRGSSGDQNFSLQCFVGDRTTE